MKLAIKAITKFIIGVLIVGALLFVPAGSLGYLNGWLFMAILFLPMMALGVVLFVKSPKLLENRLSANETEKTQKGVVALSGLCFLAGFIIAGLDYRFGWSNVPTWLVIVASSVLIISYALYAEVMRENAYLSRTIKVEEEQKVIDTGLYKIIRHPMYAVTVWLFLAIPLVLKSYYSLICFALYIPIIIVRIIGEEKFLSKNLNGYLDYKTKVKYRLIPFIW